MESSISILHQGVIGLDSIEAHELKFNIPHAMLISQREESLLPYACFAVKAERDDPNENARIPHVAWGLFMIYCRNLNRGICVCKLLDGVCCNVCWWEEPMGRRNPDD